VSFSHDLSIALREYFRNSGVIFLSISIRERSSSGKVHNSSSTRENNWLGDISRGTRHVFQDRHIKGKSYCTTVLRVGVHLKRKLFPLKTPSSN